jgi:hypothetical protein
LFAAQSCDENGNWRESNPTFVFSDNEVAANTRDASSRTILCNVTAPIPGNPKKVVSGEFSKKADHGKWFGAKAKNHQRKEYHDPPEAER